MGASLVARFESASGARTRDLAGKDIPLASRIINLADTFEVLIDAFALNEPGLRSVADIVHDIDVKDGKFGRAEAAGLLQADSGRGKRPFAVTCAASAAIVAGRGVSCASCGIQPFALARAKVRSRYLSQPSSNLPLYLSAQSFMTWCGPCDAPGAQYMKKGLSGA